MHARCPNALSPSSGVLFDPFTRRPHAYSREPGRPAGEKEGRRNLKATHTRTRLSYYVPGRRRPKHSCTQACSRGRLKWQADSGRLLFENPLCSGLYHFMLETCEIAGLIVSQITHRPESPSPTHTRPVPTEIARVQRARIARTCVHLTLYCARHVVVCGR